MARAAIILAAGMGTRMRSKTPKVLHKVGGRSMLEWTCDLASQMGCERIVVVVGPQFPEVGDGGRQACRHGQCVCSARPAGDS